MKGLLIQPTKNTALGIKEREAELQDMLMAMLSGALRSSVLTNMTGEEVANATNCSGKRVTKARDKLKSSRKKRKLCF